MLSAAPAAGNLASTSSVPCPTEQVLVPRLCRQVLMPCLFRHDLQTLACMILQFSLQNAYSLALNAAAASGPRLMPLLTHRDFPLDIHCAVMLCVFAVTEQWLVLNHCMYECTHDKCTYTMLETHAESELQPSVHKTGVLELVCSQWSLAA